MQSGNFEIFQGFEDFFQRFGNLQLRVLTFLSVRRLWSAHGKLSTSIDVRSISKELPGRFAVPRMP
jgi:hypothetical protein